MQFSCFSSPTVEFSSGLAKLSARVGESRVLGMVKQIDTNVAQMLEQKPPSTPPLPRRIAGFDKSPKKPGLSPVAGRFVAKFPSDDLTLI